MLRIYSQVVACGAPNFISAMVPLPTNLDIGQWQFITVSPQDKVVVELLQYGFPAGYCGPIPTPTLRNHPSARNHPSHLAAYIGKELAHGAMLGPSSVPPFYPWCQTNPLLTRPKKDSMDRKVIMALSWPATPGCSVNGGTHTDTYLGIWKWGLYASCTALTSPGLTASSPLALLTGL